MGNINRDVLNVSMYNANSTIPLQYENAIEARNAVPSFYKKCGLIITYLLKDGKWYQDQFIGDEPSDKWLSDAFWALTITVDKFWIGGGSNPADIITPENAKSVVGAFGGSFDVTLAQGDNLIIVLTPDLAEQFVRADMNGIEIPFTQSSLTVLGKEYVAFTSDNTYDAEDYNIDINA